MKRKLIHKTITVYKDQNEWLSTHPEINLSGVVRKWIDAKMHEED